MGVKITDLVDQKAFDDLAALKDKMDELVRKYTSIATELAKGLDIPVKVSGDIDKLEQLLVTKTKEASEVNRQLNSVIQQQGEIIANTTNTRSRALMEQEKLNKASREEYRDGQKVAELAAKLGETYDTETISLIKLEEQIAANKKAQKDLQKQYQEDIKSAREKKQSVEELNAIEDKYYDEQMALVKAGRALAVSKSETIQRMKIEEKINGDSIGSYNKLSHQLELLKNVYKQLQDTERDGEPGKELEATIQNLDAHLKDMAADMGEFQRNVGNYAIAGQNGVVSTDSLTAAIQKEAKTTQDLIDQTKILEEGKLLLNKDDANYEATLAQVNAKLEENKRKLSDVSDIINKDATSVADAEAQNKRLIEALKHVDLTSDGAKDRIKELNDKIAKNTQLIKDNTPAIEDQTKATEKQQKANEGAANELLGLVGINNNFGASLKSLSESNAGGVFDGLSTKVKAFGNTLLGLLSNPWVLSFLGIAGVAAGFKWWYDYNEGLVEATKLTKEFTGKSGDDLKNFRSEVQGVADTFGKNFQDVLKTTDAMAANFGISFEEALQTVKDGFISGADANGDMLNKLQQYPAYFKEAGVSAQEFTAIVSQTKSGIFGNKGLDAIKMATERIRRMPKATAEALDSIGMSSTKIQKGLTEGSTGIMDVIQQVSGKLKELPDDSQQVGEVLKEVFGKKGADAGLAMIRSLADIKTDLSEVKEETGTLGQLQEQQMQSQIELDKTLAAVFDRTGGNFETLTTNCKLFVNNGLVAIIKGAVDIVNWLIRMYNKSIVVRSAVQSIGNSFKIMWTIAKFILKQVVDSFKALGEVVEGVVTLDFDKVKNGWTNGFKALGANLKEAATDIASSTANAFNKTMKDEIKEVNIDLDANVNSEAPTDNTRKTGKYTAPGPTEKEVKEAEKHAKELLKIIQDTDDATINAMEEGHEKEIALIRQKYKKKLDEIKGNSAEEQQLRISLALAMEKEVADSDLKYQQNLAKINLENRLASVKKGSKEELDLKLAQLEAQKAAELEAAKKSGADVNIITEKYAQQRSELEINYQNAQYEEQANLRAGDFAKQQSDLKTKYAEDLKLAGDNEQKKTKITEKYEKDLAELSEKYAVDSAQAQVDMLENLLKDESLTDTQREDLAKKLAEAKTALANATADADIAATKRAEDADKKSMNKRIENAQTWMQKVTEMLNAVSGLASAIYDGKIQKIEDEEDALDEASEKEQDRITELVDNNVITEEEGEARKRAAEEKTEKKKEELEKKKANLEYKQAVWDKANSVAQCGINTALAIMKLWADMGVAALPMQAVVAALGAIQLATILATPIPKYAKGTEHHKGGLAVVGDAGKQEVVTYDGEVWLTPDTPTLVDLPAGAAVAPSIIDYMKENPISPKSYELQNAAPIIVNDYQRLEAKLAGVNERMDSIIYQLKQTTKAEREAARDLFLQQIVKNRL